jgi:hypothetical protein
LQDSQVDGRLRAEECDVFDLEDVQMAGGDDDTLAEALGLLPEFPVPESRNLPGIYLTALQCSLGKLTALHTLDLSHGKLASMPDACGQLAALRILDLRFCSNLKALPETFGQLTTLRTLNLRGCLNLRALPGTFRQLTALRTLDLSYCSNLDALPETFDQLTALHILGLQWCNQHRALPDQQMALSDILHLPEQRMSLPGLFRLPLDYQMALSDLVLLPDQWRVLSDLVRDLGWDALLAVQKMDIAGSSLQRAVLHPWERNRYWTLRSIVHGEDVVASVSVICSMFVGHQHLARC